MCIVQPAHLLIGGSRKHALMYQRQLHGFYILHKTL